MNYIRSTGSRMLVRFLREHLCVQYTPFVFKKQKEKSESKRPGFSG
jgi:hypothetical protein